MQNDLQQLIFELQHEVNLLQMELTRCLGDADYKGARWYQKALGYTKEKLRILQSLENPNYNKIAELKGMIDRMKNFDTEGLDPAYANAYQFITDKQIHACEKQLGEFERRERKYQLDGEELVVCIEDLLAHKIECVSIELPRTSATLNLQLALNSFLIKLVGLDAENNHARIRYRGPGELKRKGFDFEDGTATKSIENVTIEDISMILQLLSRIMFDVFGLYGDKMAILRIQPLSID